MDRASAELLKQGILGVLLFFALVAIYVLWSSGKKSDEKHATDLKTLNATHAADLKTLNDTHATALKLASDQRSSDQQSMQRELLRVITEQIECLTNVANGMEAEQRAMGELRDAFDNSQSPHPPPRRSR
jgi:hypothetical protein